MILSYDEASSYATEIAKYLMLASMSSLVFVWAWGNIVSYFDSFFESTVTLDDVVDAINDVQHEIEIMHDEPTQLEITA